MRLTKWITTLLLAACCVQAQDSSPDLSSIPPDLTIPPLSEGAPTPGKRVSQTTDGWQGTPVHHVLYLPSDWKPGVQYPVLVEYAGNGGYKNKYGDVSEGTVEGSRLGYGISAGKGYLWLCLPYVEIKDGAKSNAIHWWGDVVETKRYCLTTIKQVCTQYGGDASRLILCGFSRGSIGCNYIGLHDDELAKLWRAFVCHSNYDGVIEKWPYAGADRTAALERLKRLNGRPQFISQEQSTQTIEAWLASTTIKGDFTFVPIPFRNHSDAWVLRDLPERKKLRDWLAKVVR